MHEPLIFIGAVKGVESEDWQSQHPSDMTCWPTTNIKTGGPMPNLIPSTTEGRYSMFSMNRLMNTVIALPVRKPIGLVCLGLLVCGQALAQNDQPLRENLSLIHI